MTKKNKKKIVKPINQIKLPNWLFIFIAIVFVFLLIRASQLSLQKKIDGINLKEFANSRTTKKETILAKRATIYDSKGEALAQNIYSYTLVAYLSSSRGEGYYVEDKEYTAQKISELTELDYEYVLKQLNKENTYQTYFGSKGKNLTEITKEKIASLKLEGIDFIESQTRYYPKGDFLSYILGFATQDENGKIIGKMGLESQFNDILTGRDGYKLFQKDLKGYKIANTKEEVEEAIDGKDIYLTIDTNVQFFIEQALNEVKQKYSFEELNIVVADATNGKILGISSTTSFDPNKRNIKNYLDPNISTAIEPGSTMKIFSYMAAMESGYYNGNDTFKSGIYTTADGTEIGDWDRKGWGDITFDKGFALSSNTGVVHLIKNHMDGKFLKDYYKKLGFGSKTGIFDSDTSSVRDKKETAGKLDFKYETEVLNAGFGQGILTTSVQNIKALTSIANDGILLQPYIIEKIVDADGNVVVQNKRKELGRVASKKTTDKIKDLMEDVITDGTGSNYRMDGYGLIAKTGTAQISSTNGTGYLTGANDIIRGFAGMFPKENPKVIIYATLERPDKQSVSPLVYVVKEVVTNVSKYLNIYDVVDNNNEKVENYMIQSYYNKETERVVSSLINSNITPIVIGNGNKIIRQYPSTSSIVSKDEKVFLVTNDLVKKMPNVIGYSYKDAKTLLELLGIKVILNGTGYVVNQSIAADTVLDQTEEIVLALKEKFNLTNE